MPMPGCGSGFGVPGAALLEFRLMFHLRVAGHDSMMVQEGVQLRKQVPTTTVLRAGVRTLSQAFIWAFSADGVQGITSKESRCDVHRRRQSLYRRLGEAGTAIGTKCHQQSLVAMGLHAVEHAKPVLHPACEKADMCRSAFC